MIAKQIAADQRFRRNLESLKHLRCVSPDSNPSLIINNSRVPNLKRPWGVVQIGRFGDPNGVQSTARTSRASNIAQLGSTEFGTGTGTCGGEAATAHQGCEEETSHYPTAELHSSQTGAAFVFDQIPPQAITSRYEMRAILRQFAASPLGGVWRVLWCRLSLVPSRLPEHRPRGG